MTADVDHASSPAGPSRYDLVVIGGTAGGLSVAASTRRGGLGLVRVLEQTHSVALPDLVGENELDVGYGETVTSVDVDGSDLLVTTNKQVYRSRACLVGTRGPLTDWRPPIEVPESDRVHIDLVPLDVHDLDVLVVGFTDHAVELAVSAVSQGARVVLAAGGMDPTLLSPAGGDMLRRLEKERRLTVLYRSVPMQVGEVAGYPMADFGDRRTPDLQFDHVLFASNRQTSGPADVGLTEAAQASGKVWFLGEPESEADSTTVPSWRMAGALATVCFPEIEVEPPPDPNEQRQRHPGVIDELRDEHYNATITHFEPTHSDLWVLRVKPDQGGTFFLPGQYASLGLGYWEERVDDAKDPVLDDRWDKLIRRSYSISSRMFDENGYLADEGAMDDLEFYIVLVPPTADNVPALTPRLALKRPGDRIYLGPKVAGRYTLQAVSDPAATVVFLATGTGEAPHNAMVIELLRKGHHGPVISAVSVRRQADLGYEEAHRALAERYPNYRHLGLPTREPGVEKRYIQDLIRDDGPDGIGAAVQAESVHVFLCGNPAMIGLPEEADGQSTFPQPPGVVELLTNHGLTLDRRKSPGNIHFEEYW